jgi:diguanylate cyclase (GGDEF)-like protein
LSSDKHILHLVDTIHSLHIRATTDPATGLFNHHHFVELAKREYSRAKRLRTPISILLIETGHNKGINNRRRHLAGDQALRCLADYLVANTREIDICSRYSSDELAVLLTDADRSAALAVALRILRYLDGSENIHTDPECLFEINIGIAHTHCPTGDSSIDQLMHQAEQALYIARIDARNRVYVSRAY